MNVDGRSPRGIAARAIGVARGAAALAGWRLRTRGATVVTYHDVTDDPANPTDQVSPLMLRAQLEAAVRLGVQFVPLPSLCERWARGELVDGLGAITFDDALIGVHRHAVEILADLGLPATVFVVSDRLGIDAPDWYPGSAPVMTADELDDVARAGIDIQSHSRTHADLPTLDASGLARELGDSRAALSDRLGRDVEYLAYPFGHYDERVCATAQKVGYRAAFTFRTGRVKAGLDAFRLPRLPMPSDARGLRLAYDLARPPSSFPESQLGAVTGG